MRGIGLAATLLLAAGISAPAFADDSCPPLTILTSVDMKVGRSGRVFVPAQINGTTEYMLVDTGGSFSAVTPVAVEALHLTPRHTRMKFVGVSGATMQQVVEAAFTLGNLHADSMDFIVLADEYKLANDATGVGGLLGVNLMTSYDADFDFGNKKFSLLSQKHCDGKVVYWPASTVAAVPFELNGNFQVKLHVQLDGHSYSAMLDTGASTSVLNLQTATRDFAITPGDADTPVHGHLISESGPKIYTHSFRSLSLEGVAVANPRLTLLPDLMRDQLSNPLDTVSNDTRLRDPKQEAGLADMTLGMDILHHFHLYIAYKEKMIYITPASVPAQALATPGPAPAPASPSPTPSH